ncbi:seed maturation-like protein [Senna tora]|uniref:Seed maturation-like protein n=1 Tax=Senna tora TaxID=362788 RepID=A0A834TEM2_9FABA|nr:seed maturation-like protein [Senna tora]
MAVSARASILSRVTHLSPNPFHPPKPPPSPLPSFSLPPRRRRLPSSASVVSCLVSGVDGGANFDRGFTVIANMLKRIEPLDTSVISKGVSDSAKDSMKQAISTMLGLLPSDQFSVTVTVSRRPLDRLLVSSIITGYTLWNAEYRMSLMRNLDITPSDSKGSNSPAQTEVSEEQDGVDRNIEAGSDLGIKDSECCSPRLFEELSPEALNYIQQLQSELTIAKEELNAQKQEIIQIEYDRGNRNDLLEYLRSLDPDMVTELSGPSSVEVEDIIQQLVQNILRRFFTDDARPNFIEQSVGGNLDNHPNSHDEFCVTVGTSRDYLAKLLFWCMLLGHHLRGLENRLHLSCVVGLL